MDQVEARVEQLFLQRRSSWIIQWILLYLNERYLKDDGAKLEAILQQVQLGCCSPIMYLEAAVILRKNPYWLPDLFGQSVSSQESGQYQLPPDALCGEIRTDRR